MMKLLLCLMLVLILNTSIHAQTNPALIPQPLKMDLRKGTFLLDKNVYISYADAASAQLAGFARDAIRDATGLQPQIRKGIAIAKKGKSVSLLIDPNIKSVEGYTLEVGSAQVVIRAKTANGLFYGIQTLLQLIPVKGDMKLPAIFIEDEPRFSWRGMLFDSCRHMFSVDFIKKFIDQLARHKLNKFHWHLTEDQGWRIEIKKYPRLQEVAAFRNGTQIGPDRKKDVDSIRYGGFYTQEQIKEVVAYAGSRFVEVIPEIEMPGHSVAAITAYPHLACGSMSFENGKPFEVRMVWGVSKDLYCAGNDSVFTFLEDVLNEIIALFPSKYIHIGGDEAPHDAWHKCPKCQSRMQKEQLKDESALQSWFIQRMERFINSKGKKIIGWEEIMQGGLAENATVHSWLGVQSGLKAVRNGHDAIMSPYSHMYFDGYQADPKIEPMAIGYWVPLDSVYAFEPVHPALNEQEAQRILGAQANLWTEFIATEGYLEYMVFPRIAALAEVDWSPKAKRDFGDFKMRLRTQYHRYQRLGIQFRIPVPEIALESSIQGVHNITLFNPAGFGEIRYTLDGSEVSLKSTLYKGTVKLKSEEQLKYALFYGKRKSATDYYPKVAKKK